MNSIQRWRGFYDSLVNIRLTRGNTKKLLKNHAKLEARLAEQEVRLAKLTNSLPPSRLVTKVERDLFRLSIMREISRRQSGRTFQPNIDFADAPEMRAILTNGLAVDFDGGVNENLKTVFRTPNISQRHTDDADAALISVMRPDKEQFWKVMSRAYTWHTPLYYAETSFFSGFTSYFDTSVEPAFKKSLGFIFDDMGYYFDSRQPSRLEKNLNDPNWSLSSSDFDRVRALIDEIIEKKITKYNKYQGSGSASIPEGIVLVVDQKRNDASILLGGATPRIFDKMLEAALQENPGRKIFIKPHPDNIFEAGGDKFTEGPDWQIVDENVSLGEAMERADIVYTVSSQVGFEALLRGKRVVTFGLPFYAGWGLTDDRQCISRRVAKRTVEELFFAACIELSVYINPTTGQQTTLENTIDRLVWMREAVGR